VTDPPGGEIDSQRGRRIPRWQLLSIEREALLAALAAAGIDYEVFADTVAGPRGGGAAEWAHPLVKVPPGLSSGMQCAAERTQ
jgi:hypothetical protein